MEFTHLSPPAESGHSLGGVPPLDPQAATGNENESGPTTEPGALPFAPAFGLAAPALALASPASGSTSPMPLVPPPPSEVPASGSAASVASTSALLHTADSWSRHLGPGKACARCRARKLRCSGTRPVCTACQRVQGKAERQARKAGLPPPSATEFAGLCVYAEEPSRRPRRSARTPTPGLGTVTGGTPQASFSPVSAAGSHAHQGSPPAKRARTSTSGSSGGAYNNPLDSLAAAAAATRPDTSPNSPTPTCTCTAEQGAETSLETRLNACLPAPTLLVQHIHTFAQDCPWLCPWDTSALEQRVWRSAASPPPPQEGERPHPSLLLAIIAWVHTLHPDLPAELPAEGRALLQAQSVLSTRPLPDSSPGAQYACLAHAGLCAATCCGRSGLGEEPVPPQGDKRTSRWGLDVLQARVVLDQFTFAQALLAHTWVEAGVTNQLADRLAVPSLEGEPEPDALEAIDLSLLLAGWADRPSASSGGEERVRTRRLAHAFYASLDSSPRDMTTPPPEPTSLLDLYSSAVALLGRTTLPLEADVPSSLLGDISRLDEKLVPYAQSNPADPLARSALLALLAGDMLLHTPLGVPVGEARGGRAGLSRAIQAIDRAVPLIQAGAGQAAAHPPMAAWCVTQLAAGLIRLAAGGSAKARPSPGEDTAPPPEGWGPILRALLAPEHEGGEEARQRLLQDAFQLCWLFLDQYGTRLPLGHAAKQALHRVLEQMKL